MAVSQGSSVAITWNWRWEGIKLRYGEGEGHPLPNCDFGKNVWRGVGKELVCRTRRWGITDAGSMRPCGRRPSRPSSRVEQDSGALQCHQFLTGDLEFSTLLFPAYGWE